MSGRMVSADEARDLLRDTTPSPWRAGVAPAEGSAQTKAEFVTEPLGKSGDDLPLWVTWANDPTGEYAFLLTGVAGDGPAGEANATLTAAAPDLAHTVVQQAERLSKIEALFAGGPDTPCHTTWRGEGGLIGLALPPRVECFEVPMDDLRAALGVEK